MARLALRSGNQIGISDRGLVGPDMERGGHYYVSLGEICGFLFKKGPNRSPECGDSIIMVCSNKKLTSLFL